MRAIRLKLRKPSLVCTVCLRPQIHPNILSYEMLVKTFDIFSFTIRLIFLLEIRIIVSLPEKEGHNEHGQADTLTLSKASLGLCLPCRNAQNSHFETCVRSFSLYVFTERVTVAVVPIL